MSSRGSKALVLSGGGITGIAWELGLLLGLEEGGVDVTDLDLIVGTSAGAQCGGPDYQRPQPGGTLPVTAGTHLGDQGTASGF